jgi:hypothetical protein
MYKAHGEIRKGVKDEDAVGKMARIEFKWDFPLAFNN